ncbi:MAG: DNA methyltransferase [Caldilineaceae bacterium]
MNKNAFAALWALLQQDPDRYIYPAVRKGCDQPLPPEIAADITDVSRRAGWNTPTPEVYALPTEIWRETVARRQRYTEVRAKLAAGEVQAINDLITYNLDIRQFAQDVIQTCDDADLLRAFWKAVRSVTVLDPTCGSGAFLFAALNILEPLYEACLERMEAFVDELMTRRGEAGAGTSGVTKVDDAPASPLPRQYADFRAVLDEVAQHPNQRYFIYKSIIVNNLYGVDIMPEAVEIARLRLFLKLAAQVEKNDRLPNFGIEPLPDIDFNIRAGNTLVGFATREQMMEAVRGDKLLLLPEEEEALARIEEQAADVDRLFGKFKAMQTTHDLREFGDDYAATKRELRRRLGVLEGELNRLLAVQYGKNPDKLTEYPQWLEAHQPFHWFIEFYGIIQQGGFDVIIGNPPYVEYKEIKNLYSVQNFITLPCGDLYAYAMERSYKLSRSNSYFGMIVPISIFGVDGFKQLQELTIGTLGELWVSHFANRPSQLFQGAQKRLTIVIGKKGISSGTGIFTTRYLRWLKSERDILFPSRIQYTNLSAHYCVFPTSLEKIGSRLEFSTYSKLTSSKKVLEQSLRKSRYIVYYTRKFGYFLAFLNFIPQITEIKSGKQQLPSELKTLEFQNEKATMIIVAALSSSTFFWFWNILSDCRNLNRRDLLAFPLSLDSLSELVSQALSELGKKLMESLRTTSRMMEKSGLKIETFQYSHCKPLIDQIDAVLAQHYGFTAEELDFIINYDIKYRMGAALDGAADADDDDNL